MAQKFVVHKTNLLDARGNKVGDGEVIELSDPKLIRKFNRLGFLRPYIEDIEPEDDADDDDEDEPSEPVGRRRTAAITENTRLSSK